MKNGCRVLRADRWYLATMNAGPEAPILDPGENCSLAPQEVGIDL